MLKKVATHVFTRLGNPLPIGLATFLGEHRLDHRCWFTSLARTAGPSCIDLQSNTRPACSTHGSSATPQRSKIDSTVGSRRRTSRSSTDGASHASRITRLT